MVWCVNTLDGENILFLADKMKIVPNGEGGNLAQFYRENFNTETRDSNGHIYATFQNELVAAYYLDNIIGIKQISGIADDEFTKISREMFFGEPTIIEDIPLEDEDGGECEEVTE